MICRDFQQSKTPFTARIGEERGAIIVEMMGTIQKFVEIRSLKNWTSDWFLLLELSRMTREDGFTYVVEQNRKFMALRKFKISK